MYNLADIFGSEELIKFNEKGEIMSKQEELNSNDEEINEEEEKEIHLKFETMLRFFTNGKKQRKREC